jgi:hypothetical protein
MSFPLFLSLFYHNNDDDRSRKSNWRCEMHERGKNVTQISSSFSILSSHIECVCVYDRFITERKWRNKTPLFFLLAPLSQLVQQRESHQINLFQQSWSGLYAVVVNLFFPSSRVHIYIYLCVTSIIILLSQNNQQKVFIFSELIKTFYFILFLISHPEIEIVIC